MLDGVAYAVMVGCAESFFSAFAVALGHGNAALAVLLSVPLLCSSLVQLASARLAARLGGPKRLVVVGVALQALSLLGFLALAVRGDTALAPLLLAKCCFWVAGSVTGPAWNAWMVHLTAHVARIRYLAMRSFAVQAVLLLCFICAGQYLSAARAEGRLLAAYATLFALAACARAVSAAFIAGQAPPPRSGARARCLRTQLRLATQRGRLRVPFAIAVLMFGTYVAVPFFTPYMLRTLQLDLGTFALLTSVSMLAKALGVPLWRRAAEALGLPAAFVAAVVLISLTPALWTLPATLPLLASAQVIAGIGWGGFELVSAQILFENTPEEAPVEYFAFAGALSGLAQVAGGLIATLALDALGLSYQQAFACSAGLRALALLVLLPALPGAEIASRAVARRLRWRRPEGRPSRRGEPVPEVAP